MYLAESFQRLPMQVGKSMCKVWSINVGWCRIENSTSAIRLQDGVHVKKNVYNMQSAQFCRMMKLQVCMRRTAWEGPGAGNPKQRGGYIHVVRSWEEFWKSQLKQLGFGSPEKCLENANVRADEKEIHLQCEAVRSDAEVDKCGVALRCRPCIHPAPPQLLGRLLLHTPQLRGWMMLMHAHPPTSTAQVRLHPQWPPTTKFARHEEESGVQTILGTVWTQKKVLYPLPSWYGTRTRLFEPKLLFHRTDNFKLQFCLLYI